MAEKNYYFSHDNNAVKNLDIQKLKMAFRDEKTVRPFEAVGIYWTVLEAMHARNGFLDGEDFDALSYAEQIPVKRLNAVIEKCLCFGLFKQAGDGKIFSQEICDNISYISDMKELASKGGKASANNRPLQADALTDRFNRPLQADASTIKENKINKNKINKTKENEIKEKEEKSKENEIKEKEEKSKENESEAEASLSLFCVSPSDKEIQKLISEKGIDRVKAVDDYVRNNPDLKKKSGTVINMLRNDIPIPEDAPPGRPADESEKERKRRASSVISLMKSELGIPIPDGYKADMADAIYFGMSVYDIESAVRITAEHRDKDDFAERFGEVTAGDFLNADKVNAILEYGRSQPTEYDSATVAKLKAMGINIDADDKAVSG